MADTAKIISDLYIENQELKDRILKLEASQRVTYEGKKVDEMEKEELVSIIVAIANDDKRYGMFIN